MINRYFIYLYQAIVLKIFQMGKIVYYIWGFNKKKSEFMLELSNSWVYGKGRCCTSDMIDFKFGQM